jgi:hypothetical protein
MTNWPGQTYKARRKVKRERQEKSITTTCKCTHWIWMQIGEVGGTNILEMRRNNIFCEDHKEQKGKKSYGKTRSGETCMTSFCSDLHEEGKNI